MTPDGRRFVLAAAVLAAALGVSCSALAADGGSGTYTVSAGSYDFDLVNRGTTPWQAFTLTAPTGTAFVGERRRASSPSAACPGSPTACRRRSCAARLRRPASRRAHTSFSSRP